MEKYQMLCGKILFSSLSLFESETIFLQKLFQKEKKSKNYCYGFMSGKFQAFVIRWSAEIAGCWSQLKPLMQSFLMKKVPPYFVCRG